LVRKRGETLKEILFTIAALIFVIPMLFKLPIGLSQRGKIVVLVISLFLSLLGTIAKSVIPLWQLGLLLLLLTMAMTYLLDRQFGHALYAAANEEEEEDDKFTFRIHNETAEEEEIVYKDDDTILPTELSEYLGIDESITTVEEEDIRNEDVETLENDEDIQFLEYRSEWFDHIDPNDIDEVEENLLVNEGPFFTEEEEASLLDTAEIEEQVPDQRESLTDDLSDWHLVDEQPEELMADEMISEIENVSNTDVHHVSPLQKQLLHTVITELQVSRNYLDKAEYEQRILQCLQAPLSDQDYYVFARLLTEYYLLEKDDDKLASWLIHLREKFAHYPILLEEINFLYDTFIKSLGTGVVKE
jgi:hypothetical protein